MQTATVHRFVSGVQLMTAEVRDRDGDGIGKVEDYMFDSTSGCVDHAVVSFGGFMGFGGKLFAVPWNALKIDPQHYGFVMDVTREQLEQAPHFTRGDRPDPNDQDYMRRVAGYWHVPYPAAQPSGEQPGNASGDTRPAQGDPSRPMPGQPLESMKQQAEVSMPQRSREDMPRDAGEEPMRSVGGEPGTEAPYRPGQDYPQGGGDYTPRMPGEPGADYPPGRPGEPGQGGYAPGRTPEREPGPDTGGWGPGRGGDM